MMTSIRPRTLLAIVAISTALSVAVADAQVYQPNSLTASSAAPIGSANPGQYTPAQYSMAPQSGGYAQHQNFGVTPVQFQQQQPAATAGPQPALASSTHAPIQQVQHTIISPPGELEAQPGEHPLAPAVRWAKQGLVEIDRNIQDYCCTLVKRERVGGELREYEYMFAKVRHHPLSIYVYFLGPPAVKGREAIYVQGRNEGNILAHPNGIQHKLVGTVSLKPTSMLAMAGNRYPITEMGIRRLVERLIEVGEHDMQYGECEVKIMHNAKINGRDALCVQVVHPFPRKEFIFHMARIYIDTATNLPCRYEAYEWPSEPNGPPVLIEEYTFLDMKVNNNFTDADFDERNPNYAFR